MNALVKSKPERGLWLEQIAEPKIGINDVLIRVHYTGICGTDVAYLRMGRLGAENRSRSHGHRA